jgi:hypothetical protein
MKWIRQVGHVSAKDLRYSWWSIGALLAGAAIAASGFVTRGAMGPIVSFTASSTTETLSMSEFTVSWLPLVIVTVGILALAILVQADRPLQADSFWTTRPLAPTAVLGAKLLLAAVAITLVPLAAGFVSLRSLHTPVSVAGGMLAHAALVHLSLLLATILVAALTEDMKGFVSASVGLLAALLLSIGLFTEITMGDFDIPSSVAFVAPAVAIVLLTFLYRGRRCGNARRAAGLAVALLLMIGAIVAPNFDTARVPMLSTGPRVSFTFGTPGETSGILPFRMYVDDSSSARFAFARDLTVISDERGTRNLTPMHDTIVAGAVLPDLGQPIHWILLPVGTRRTNRLAISPADSQAITRGATSAELRGVVTVLHPRVLSTMPLRDGAFAEKDGRFVGIYGVSHDSAHVSVYVHTVSAQLPGGHLPDFAIVNFERGEGMLLDEHPSSGSGDGWVVLPWIRVMSSFGQFSTSDRVSLPRDSGWYDKAKLVAVDWVPAARYNAAATMRLR